MVRTTTLWPRGSPLAPPAGPAQLLRELSGGLSLVSASLIGTAGHSLPALNQVWLPVLLMVAST